MAASTSAPDAAPVWRARLVTYGLVVALAVPVASGVELWPFSQFELFSGVRTGESVSYELVTVDAGRAETKVDLALVPASLGRVHHLLPTLSQRSMADQQETVRLWLSAVRDADPATDVDEAVAARVYAVRRTVPTVDGGTPTVLARTLVDEVPLS